MNEPTLPGFDSTPSEIVSVMPLDERIARAIALLKEYEPEDGYYLAFSGLMW